MAHYADRWFRGWQRVPFAKHTRVLLSRRGPLWERNKGEAFNKNTQIGKTMKKRALLILLVLLTQSVHGQAALKVSGEIETTAGIRFPDGSLQTTASGSAAADTISRSLTGNSGLYSNVISDFVPPLSYTEVCFKDGMVLSDVHTLSESPSGGSCEPGDTGWIIERLERASSAAMAWVNARAECLRDGMRLPEYFEWHYTCNNAGLFGVSDMTDNFEWVSNEASVIDTDANGLAGNAVGVQGSGSCGHAGFGFASRTNSAIDSFQFRCAR